MATIEERLAAVEALLAEVLPDGAPRRPELDRKRDALFRRAIAVREGRDPALENEDAGGRGGRG